MSLEIDLTRPDMVKVTFRLHVDPSEGALSVVGSFNDWTPGMDELVSNGNGTRAVTVGVPYDQHMVFRYLAAGGAWSDEPEADAVIPEGSVLNGVPRAGR